MQKRLRLFAICSLALMFVGCSTSSQVHQEKPEFGKGTWRLLTAKDRVDDEESRIGKCKRDHQRQLSAFTRMKNELDQLMAIRTDGNPVAEDDYVGQDIEVAIQDLDASLSRFASESDCTPQS